MRTPMQSPPERPPMNLLASLRYIGAVGSLTKHTRPVVAQPNVWMSFFTDDELARVEANAKAGVSVADCAAQIIAGRAK